MNRFYRAVRTVLPVAILALCIIGLYVFIGQQPKSEPNNPLLNEADKSHMLLTLGGDIPVSEDILNTEEVTEEKISKQNAEISEEKNKKSDNNDSDVKVEEDKSGNEKSDNKTSDNYNTKDNGDNQNLGNKGKTNHENSGEEQNPVDNEVNKVYFETTITDGETVNSRDYSFEIIHKTDLTINSVNIYVNDNRQVQFNGNVLLNEGSNTIRIAVSYIDDNGKKISVYCDYIVNVDLGDIAILTNLTNHETDTDILEFNATATCDNNDLPVQVTIGGEVIDGSNGIYSVKLKSGENIIVLYAESGEHSASQRYKVICNVPDNFAIYTDLTDKAVNAESIDFTAYVLNGTSRSKLTVVINGNTIEGKDNNFIVNLNIGNNVIRLKATDKVDGETIAINQSYVIKLVPITDENTAPQINYINVTDDMTVKGNEFTMDIEPVDYRGNRIYYNGITVTLNGMKYPYTWSSEYTSYLLWFESGENKLDIRITDKDGRYTDYSYIINCQTLADGEKKGKITISIDANVLGLGYIVSPAKIDIYQGESGADVIARFLEENGFIYSYSGTLDVGFYLSRISKQGIGVGVSISTQLVDFINADGLEWKTQKYDDSLGEFDYCQGSGWMYCVNQDFPNYGFSDVVFKDGDVVRLRFTLAYGKDIGGFNASGGTGEQNYEKIW